MRSIEERKRDPFFTEEAYAGCLEDTDAMFNGPKFVEDRTQIKAKFDAAGARQVSFARVSYLIEDVWGRYSAGDSLVGIRERIQYVFEDLRRHHAAFPADNFKLWEPDAYYFTLLLMSWAVLFNLPEHWETLAAFISKESDDGEDPYMRIFFTTLGVKDFPGQNAALLHPDPYGILYDSLRGNDRAVQQKAMPQYLKRWYKSKAIKGCYWHDLHTVNPSAHLGYWAFETGMLTVLNKLDDSSYREMNFYPRDMVDYCKEQGWQEEVIAIVRSKREG